MVTPTIKGINTLVSIGGVVIGGQTSASLRPNVKLADVTDMIAMNWQQVLPNVKGWSVACTGLVIKDDEGWTAIKNAFLNNSKVDLKMTDGSVVYSGEAYVTSFPIQSDFAKGWRYNVMFTGTGPLN